MLVYDTNNDGKITERNQIVFTDWDPTAANDMAALKNVFDTNGNGQLDAGDANFAKFKLMVTNADGTTTLKTLSEAGVASINLIPDASRIVLPDGSVIDGQTTFTKTAGGTGLAAAVALSSDVSGYSLNRSVMTNGDGSTTIVVKAINPDGSLAEETTLLTSADGKTRTLSSDRNGDRVVDQVQTIATVLNADGSTTETLTNRTGSAVLIDQTTTTLSADRKITTIARDATGDGLTDQTETRTTASDGATTIVISDLNPNASLKAKSTSVTSANGLTRTTSLDLDGNTSNDVTEVNATVVNGDGSRTQTVTKTNNNGSLRNKEVTTTTADSRAKTTQSDINGDGTFDTTSAMIIAIAADRSSTTTDTITNTDGSLRSKTVTAISADGLSKTIQSDVTSDNIFDLTTSDITVVNGDGSRTQTITDRNSDASVRAKSVIVKGADGKTRTTQTDADGDGAFDRVETIAINGANNTVATVNVYNKNGSLNARSMTITSADGLTVASETDIEGDGVIDRKTTGLTVKNADGSSTVTETNKARNDAILDKTITTTTANGLSITTQRDTNGDGTFEVTRNDILVVNGDGSRTQTVTDRNTNNSLRAQTVTSTSADRKTLTINQDSNGDGVNELQQSVVTQMNGTVVDTLSRFNPNGSLLDKLVVTKTATGLSKTTQFDENGDNTFDLTRTDVTVFGSDGGRTQTVSETNANGTLRNKSETSINATGFSSTVKLDLNGDNTYDLTRASNTVLNADGSQTQTASNTNTNGSLRNRTEVTTAANGLSTTTKTDLDGDGSFDRTLTDSITLNANGSRVETIADRNANNTLRSQTVVSTSADRRVITTSVDSNGDGANDQVRRVENGETGTVFDTVTDYAANGAIIREAATLTSKNGMSVATFLDLNGDGTDDIATFTDTYINADGSTTQYIETYKGVDLDVLVNGVTIETSADGRRITKTEDFDGDGLTDLTTTDVFVPNADGSEVRTVTHTSANGTRRNQTTTTVSADRKTTTMEASVNDNGPVQLRKVTALQTNGDTLTTVTYPNVTDNPSMASAVATRSVSANGLKSALQISDNTGDAIKVERVYQNALHRAPSLTELNTYVSQLNANTLTRAALLNQLSENLEHFAVENIHAVTNNTASGNATFDKDHTTDKHVAADVVRRLYDSTFDRAATASEITTQSNKILNGTKTEAQVAADILALPEFSSRYGTLTHTAFVAQIFTNSLGRAPTSAESSFWSSAISSGKVTRADFVYGIAQSSEHLAISGASYGSAGNDTIYSRDGADTIDGAGGIDTLDFSLLTNPGVSIDLIAGRATQAGNVIDTIANIENLVGSEGNDTLIGSNGANVLTGKAGQDIFAFKGAFGADTVTDFRISGSAHDLLQFDAAAFSSASAVLAASQQVGNDVKIQSGANSVILKSVALADLTASHIHIS